jgi:hypothetical protein
MAIMIDIRIQFCAEWSRSKKGILDSMNKKYFLLLAAIGMVSLTARADIIPTLSSVTGSSPNFTWNYSANVTINETINTGDFFTIYDFGSIAPGSNMQPAGWTFSQALVGPTAALTSPTDNASILNLTWTYSGTTPITGSAALGIFSVITSTDQLKTGQFTAQATRNSGASAGTKISNIGDVSVPVPEPSALFPILSICAAIGVDRFLRRRKTA